MAAEPHQVKAPVTHRYPKRQQNHHTPAPRVQAQKRKPGRPPRVAPSKMPMVTQEEINHMSPTIPMATHNMAINIEDGTLPCYLSKTVVDTDTRDLLQYKDLMQ